MCGCYNCRWQNGDYAVDEDYDASAPCSDEEREERKADEDNEEGCETEDCELWESTEIDYPVCDNSESYATRSLSKADRNLEFGGVNYP